MSRPDDLLEPDDESEETDECRGIPTTVKWLIDVQADREYEERKEEA